MNAVLIIWLVVTFTAQAISFFANLTLIQNLKDFYPEAYTSAGSPTMAALISYDINFKWLHYLLSGKFRSDPLTPAQLVEAYKFAYWSGWLSILSLVAFVVVMVITVAL